MNSPLIYPLNDKEQKTDSNECELKRISGATTATSGKHLKLVKDTIEPIEPEEILSYPKHKRIKKSSIFWNFTLLFPLITIGIIDVRLLYLTWGIGSIFSIGFFFDRYRKTPLWTLWMPFTWFIIVGYGLLLGIRKVKDGIRYFNEKLDQN